MCEKLIYEISKNPSLLLQYYMIREKCYKEVWGLKIFSGAEDEHDRKGYILIVRDKKKVVGGGRLVLRPAGSPERLPLETESLLLEDALGRFGLEGKIIGEIGRIAVLPEFIGYKLSKISLCLLGLAKTQHCNFLTTVAPLEQAKKYRRIGKRLNLDIEILDNVIIEDRPYYNQIEMKLLVCDLSTVADIDHFLAPCRKINS